jgi:hypothetical protein
MAETAVKGAVYLAINCNYPNHSIFDIILFPKMIQRFIPKISMIFDYNRTEVSQ